MKLVAVVPNKFLPVPPAREGERLDAGLAKMLGMSRTQVAELIDSGKVLVNGALVDKATKLDSSQLIEVNLESTEVVLEVTAEDVPELAVVFQDSDIVVIDKPAGVVSHPSWDLKDHRCRVCCLPGAFSFRLLVLMSGKVSCKGWTLAPRV